MPRSSDNTLPFRAPFGGLWDGAPQQCPVTPRMQCVAALNVETIHGDLRRRPGLAQYAASSAENRVSGGLRSLSFEWGTPGEPYLAWLCQINGSPELVIWHLTGSGLAEVFRRGIVGETVGSETHYHLGMAKLGSGLFIFRVRSEAEPRLCGSDWVEYPLWLAMPSEVEISQTADGFLPAGTYRFCATYVNNLTGAESPASLSLPCATAGVYIAAGSRAHVRVTAPITPGVNRVRVYTQLIGTDTQWYRAADVPYTGGWTEIILSYSVSDRSAANTLDVLGSYQPGPGRDLTVWQGRLWVVEAPNTLACSDAGVWHAFRVANTWAAGPDASDEITRVIPTPTALFILKDRSWYALSGTGPDNYVVQELATGLELGSPHAVAVIGGRLYAALVDGLYAAEETGLACLSKDIRGRWARCTSWHTRTLGGDPERGLLLVHGQTGLGWETLVYDPETRQWWVWVFSASEGGALATTRLGLGQRARLVFLASDSGYAPYGAILALRGDDEAVQDDFGQSVNWSWQGAVSDLGTDWRKCLWSLTLLWDAEMPGGDCLVQVVPNESVAAAWSATLALAGAPGRAQYPLGLRARRTQLRLSGSGSSRPRLVGYELQATAEGQT